MKDINAMIAVRIIIAKMMINIFAIISIAVTIIQLTINSLQLTIINYYFALDKDNAKLRFI